MSENNQEGINRRSTLECLIWAGTGVLWTMVGGVPRSSSLLGASEARAQAASGFTFLQISDSHIGFKGAANPDPMAMLEEAMMKIDTLPDRPAFVIHTGDISHVSQPEQFDNADKVIAKAGLDTFYVPGEHDILDPGSGKAYFERCGKGFRPRGRAGIRSTRTGCISSTW
jgi:hypothetical protein